jgi:hypothetical protein
MTDNENLREQAKAYVDALPDETAAGRLVDDAGEAADEKAWDAAHAQQESELGETES